MKVKEVIKFEGWVYGSGRSWQDTYAENIIEIKESELPKTADDYDWDWYELPEENPEDSWGRDTKIVIEYYSEDAHPDYDEPLAKVSKWESEIWAERNS